MTSPIDPIRRAAAARRLRRARDDEAAPAASETEDRSLPVPIEGSARTEPPPAGSPKGAAVFAAQLMGQDGQKRGLRGGPPVLNAAKASYNRAEWSGPADRRAPKGRMTKTDI